jgi:hypothetical protein
MGLLSPWFLGGLAAIGLPVWLHLLRKHKTTPMRFSSLMFFETREQSSVKHRRLDYLLLFSLRSLLLALLVLAFASPYIMGGPTTLGGGKKLTVVAVDNSFSMRQGDRLSRARQEAIGVLSGLTGADRAQVLAFAGQVQLMGEPTSDQAALRGAVQAIRQDDSRGSYGDLVRALRSIAQSSRLGLEVHLFSDLQKTSMPSSFVELALPPGARLTLHSVAARRLPNWAVESVTAPKLLQEGKKTRVQATIAGYGTDAAAVRVSLVVRDNVLEAKSVEVPAGGRATVEFLSLEAPHGWSRAEIRLESRDEFSVDDHFWFPVDRSDASRILFVHEQRDARSSTYFQAALEAASQSVFAMDSVTPSQLSGVSPSRYAFVVLSNVLSVPASFEDELKKFVRGGGSALIAVGPAASARGKIPVFEGTVAESRYASRQGERFQTVDWLDAAHPSIRRANRWEGVKFYQVFRIEAPGARVLARVTDQTPILLEKQEGAGRVMLFASTFDNIANDFPLHSAFVPFVEQTARYLGGLEESVGSLPVGAYYELRKTRAEGGATDVLDPNGRRVLDLSQTSSALGFTLAEEGFYEIRRGNGRQELVAVNADRRESDFDPISKETLALWQNTGEGAAAASGTSTAAAKPISFWWYVLLVAFLLAVAESVVAGRFLTIKKEAA